MDRSTLVLYVGKTGSASLLVLDEKGMVTREQSMASVRHVKIEADGCSIDVSFAEFEAAVVIRVSGSVSYEQRSCVLGVRCVGD